jgi:ATP-binding cassette subfamily B protein
VQVVQAFGRERAAVGRFDEINRSQLAAVRRTNGIAARYVAFVDAISTVIVGGVLATGGLLASRDQVTVGTVTAFVLYLNNFWEPVGQLSQLLNTVQSARAGLNRIDRLLAEPDHLTDPAEPMALPARGTLVVDGVTFRYAPDSPAALSDVSLTVAAGERLAVVGPTGAGKSTLARLLVRLDDPSVGAVRWDGVDLRSAGRTELRERLLLVPQEGRLFQGTVAGNVRLARPDATDDEVARALDAVGALTWARGLPDGLATEVDEDGGRLSAGERQLVSLARAALADPGLLVLDEATSNLDPVTELAVDRAVEALAEGRTMVVVAHRLSSAERADRVAVIDGGRLAELGSHAELVAAGGRYARLHAAWVTGDTPIPSLPH